MKFGLAYIATPYTRHPEGHDTAFQEAARITGRLILAGVHAYSPIVHGHVCAFFGRIDPLDEKLWQGVNGMMLAKADTLVVAQMEGWADSGGIKDEVLAFERANKPVFDLHPPTLAMARRQMAQMPRAFDERGRIVA